MGIEALFPEFDSLTYVPLRKQRDYGGYQNKTEKMPWSVKDIPFKELSRGLCGYCEVLSTKAVAIGSWLKHDMPELARTLFHEELHKNGILDEYMVLSIENGAFMHWQSPYQKQMKY